MNAHDFTFNALDGSTLALQTFQGKPFLLCNTATLCGFSQQLHDLTTLHEAGYKIIATPSNDFGQQEPDNTETLACTLKDRFKINFPVTTHVHIRHHPHPFYAWLKKEVSLFGYPRWNYYKYIFDHNGNLVQWFSPLVSPKDPKITLLLR